MRMLTIAVASLSLAAPAAAVNHKPTLVMDRATAVVRGTSFKAREVVRVVVVGADAPWSKSIRATAAGTFRVSLPAGALPRCGAYVVRATGNQGSKASLAVRTPECNPQ
jgi:hypothetical protein